MGTEPELMKKRAPTLYAIIIVKILKGLLFLSVALMVYTLSDNDLPEELRTFLHHVRLNPERKFWTDVSKQVGHWTEVSMVRVAAGSLILSAFSLVEGIGLMFRASWAGWMAIGESAFFIPIEIYELIPHRPQDPAHTGHPLVILTILAINIWIVWYLVKNKDKLFRHHHH